MPYAINKGARIYYETTGTGEPLAMVIGLGGVIQAWGLQIAELSKHYRVVALDNRGAGKSDKPDEPYPMALFADDLRAVLDHAGIDSAHVMGASLGGLIAQEFYHLHPSRTRSLVLACTGVSVNHPKTVPPSAEVWETLTIDRGNVSRRAIMESMTEIFYSAAFRERVVNLVDRLLKYETAAPQPAHAYTRQLQSVFDYRPDAGSPRDIDVPVLVVHGDQDRVWPVANARLLADEIPGARLHIIAGAGHMVMVEASRDYNRAVLNFLLEIRERRPEG